MAAPIYETMFYATPHFHHCLVDGRVVALDMRTTRYFLIHGASGEALIQWEAGAESRHSDETFDDLLAKGYVSREQAGNRRLEACAAKPLKGRAEICMSSANRAEYLQIAWFLATTRLRIATGSLARTLKPMRKRAGQMPVREQQVVEDRVGRFTACRPSIPLPRVCLLDSVALYHFVGDSMTELVFGVSLEPFAAHCWLERDGWLLNDEIDHVRRFTPIMRCRA